MPSSYEDRSRRNKLEADQKYVKAQKDRTEPQKDDVRVGAYDGRTGRYQVLHADGGVTSNGVALSNGAPPPDGFVRGFRSADSNAIGLGYRAFVSRAVDEEVAVDNEEISNIIFLFQGADGLYIGGDRPEPVRIYDFSVGASFVGQPTISKTGEGIDEYIVHFVVQILPENPEIDFTITYKLCVVIEGELQIFDLELESIIDEVGFYFLPYYAFQHGYFSLVDPSQPKQTTVLIGDGEYIEPLSFISKHRTVGVDVLNGDIVGEDIVIDLSYQTIGSPASGNPFDFAAPSLGTLTFNYTPNQAIQATQSLGIKKLDGSATLSGIVAESFIQPLFLGLGLETVLLFVYIQALERYVVRFISISGEFIDYPVDSFYVPLDFLPDFANGDSNPLNNQPLFFPKIFCVLDFTLNTLTFKNHGLKNGTFVNLSFGIDFGFDDNTVYTVNEATNDTFKLLSVSGVGVALSSIRSSIAVFVSTIYSKPCHLIGNSFYYVPNIPTEEDPDSEDLEDPNYITIPEGQIQAIKVELGTTPIFSLETIDYEGLIPSDGLGLPSVGDGNVFDIGVFI